MATTSCVVIALSETVRNLTAALLKFRGLEVTPLPSLQDLPATLQQISVCGILLEVITSLKSSPQDKKKLHELAAFYPFGKFKMVGNQVLIIGKASLDGFVDECRRFSPRTLRKELRRTEHLAVYLSADATFDHPEQVVTVNISNRGCFVYSIREWDIDRPVWIRLLGKDTVMCGKVCWWDSWGNNKTIPGIGIKLDDPWKDG